MDKKKVLLCIIGYILFCITFYMLYPKYEIALGNQGGLVKVNRINGKVEIVWGGKTKVVSKGRLF